MAVLCKEIVWKLLTSHPYPLCLTKGNGSSYQKNKRNWKKKSPNGASYLEIASSTSSFNSALKIHGAVQCLFVNHGSVPLRKNLLFLQFESPHWWTLQFESKIDSMLRSIVQSTHIFLTQIRIQHCSDRSLTLVAQRCPNLEVLSIRSSIRVTDYSISMIAFGCPNLRELDISYCYRTTHKSLVVIGRNCPNVKVLKRNRLQPTQHVDVVPARLLNVSPQDGDSEAAAIANYMPHLEWLEVRYPKC